MIELKSGMKVTVANGREYIITGNTGYNKLIAVYINKDGKLNWVGAFGFTENLSSDNFDVVKVETTTCVGDPWGKVVWEKSKTPLLDKITEDYGKQIVEELLQELSKC